MDPALNPEGRKYIFYIWLHPHHYLKYVSHTFNTRRTKVYSTLLILKFPELLPVDKDFYDQDGSWITCHPTMLYFPGLSCEADL